MAANRRLEFQEDFEFDDGVVVQALAELALVVESHAAFVELKLATLFTPPGLHQTELIIQPIEG